MAVLSREDRYRIYFSPSELHKFYAILDYASKCRDKEIRAAARQLYEDTFRIVKENEEP